MGVFLKNQKFFVYLIFVFLLNFSFPYCDNIIILRESKEFNNEIRVSNDNERIVELKVNNENTESVSIKNLEELKYNVLEEINGISNDYNSKDPSSLSTKNAYAIVVGVENYPGYDYDLQYCADDASEIRSYLISGCNFKSSNIWYLLNSQGTHSAILNAFSQIASIDTTNDVFFFYFSGHGGWTGAVDEYICPYDSIPSTPSNRLTDDELDSLLDILACSEKYVVIDACFSGGMIPESQAAGRYLMTACQDYETSLETYELRNGVFTYYFLRSSNYATDWNGDNVISMEEQFDYTYPQTVSYAEDISEEQHPREYDGISGQAVLYPSIGSLTLTPTGNQLAYSFFLYGNGKITLLNISVCSVVNEIVINITDLTEDSVTNTGFDFYSGTKTLGPGETITGYEIEAKIVGNSEKTFKQTFGDYDEDGLYDIYEITEGNGIDPRLNDTDSDYLSDGLEVNTYDSNPLVNDSDNDSLLDGDEVYNHSTNPILADTDHDGLLDGDEVYNHSTSPILADTDSDGLNDNLEINTYFTNATLYDTDKDGYSDGWEVANGYDPLNPYSNPKFASSDDNDDSDNDSDNETKNSNFTIPINWGLLIMAVVGIVAFVAIKQNKKRKLKARTKKEYNADKFRKSEQTNPFISDLKTCKNCGKINSKEATTCVYCKASLPIHLGYSSEFLSRNSPEKNLNDTKAIIKDFIMNKLPPPKSQLSPENREALLMGVMANKKLSEGNIIESIYLMLTALKLGIPEPMNSEIRSYLLDSLDNDFKGINIVNFPSFFGILKCKTCGNYNEPSSKFCTKCGAAL